MKRECPLTHALCVDPNCTHLCRKAGKKIYGEVTVSTNQPHIHKLGELVRLKGAPSEAVMVCCSTAVLGMVKCRWLDTRLRLQTEEFHTDTLEFVVDD